VNARISISYIHLGLVRCEIIPTTGVLLVSQTLVLALKNY